MKLGEDTLPLILLKQAAAEITFMLRNHGLSFRKRENAEAVRAYSEMSAEELEAINARQKWANWRTIPKNLSGALPARAISAIDLCCGVGHSTDVLASYLAPGSKIVGIDSNPEFIRHASARHYTHRSGRDARVSFHIQSVLKPFHSPEGEKIPDGTIDLVNSSGAVGNHFNEEATRTLAREVARVLKRGGLAMIDSGPPGTSTNQLISIFQSEGFGVSKSARSWFADPFTQVCFRKY